MKKELESENSLNFNSSLKKLEKEVNKEGIEIRYLKRLYSQDNGFQKIQRDHVPRLEPLISLKYYGVFV
ncbi:hypothetical protein KAT80_00620 [Candidatus Pacearchaeota archaeon]|nr:hypothetical protein [Candidatus Pacearchaeota archaeon]